MTWYLVVLAHVYLGAAPTALPHRFSSEEACQMAGADWKRQMGGYNDSFVCVKASG